MRHYRFADKICLHLDKMLKTLNGDVHTTGRPDPAAKIPETHLSSEERRHVAGLMRVNHVGEVCAQALYQGQALTAKSPEVRTTMADAAREEQDHLHWCQQRLHQLQSHVSYLNPFWYSSSFILGALSGWLGDRWSLGVVVETEKQVERHLADHLQALPPHDLKSRAILANMKEDEAQHARTAQLQGAMDLPAWIKTIMSVKAKVMTTTAYWI